MNILSLLKSMCPGYSESGKFNAALFDGSKLTISLTKSELVEVTVTTAEGLFPCASRKVGIRLSIKRITSRSAYTIYSSSSVFTRGGDIFF
ncbi:EspG domain-containing protein [Escherichia sp. MOD1-EC7003]|uniref:EspG domain-containing protein n=1 Tax=Escherichia sp. MOD1-EC7003 TaxID=2093900 RepID=UPI00406CD9F8